MGIINKIILFFSLLFSACQIPNSTEKLPIKVIPLPQQMELTDGVFQINETTTIAASPKLTNEGSVLANLIQVPSSIYSKDQAASIGILLIDSIVGKEKYRLTITPKHITIEASTNQGALHAVQTLLQLNENGTFPCIKIIDEPKFIHRGMLLDCSRHFFSKEVVKKQIDILSMYKMNTLHWHLTEDQGWRIQIDKYPKLTEIGAWRTEEDGSKYGGFYSKKDLREVIDYATKKHINIIPEIELPGHSQAAIASYPHLSCEGKPVKVANDWGVFKEIYCAGNDSVFIFLEDVLTEVMELFPGQYIHIGGDEAPKFRWENCSKCQQRMADNNLETEHELQSWFIQKIEQFLKKNGRTLIGWDEILEGGLAKNAVVQSWRGEEGGIAAASSNHYAIMSPTSHCYFDYDLKSIDLEKVYQFNPIPDTLTVAQAQFILGGECNLWSEHIPDEATLESKVLPRMLAMSEILWNYPTNRNFDDFYQRVQLQYPHLKAMNINYGLEAVPVEISIERGENQTVYTHLSSDIRNTQIRYCVDSGKGCEKQPYTTQIPINFSGTLRTQAHKNGVALGDEITQVFQSHLALGIEPKYLENYNEWYTGGGKIGLTDGRIGTRDFRDGNWQGFWGSDMETIIDLGDMRAIETLSTNCYQYNNAWIFLPEFVEFYASGDGLNYTRVKKIRSKTKPTKRGKLIENYTVQFSPITARYVKLVVKNIGKVPNWHEAAGSDAWVFIDEFIVQ